jgi:outer membrane protein OmpA-like peptidoglycan-associated protein
MKNPKQALLFLILLGVILGVSFILPKGVQNSDKFQPLADQMISSIPAAKELKMPSIVLTDIPSPSSVTPGKNGAVTPASNSTSSQPTGPDPVMMIQTALAAGDHTKAESYLKLAKERLDPATMSELTGLVTASRERAKKLADESVKAAAEATSLKAALAKAPASAESSKALAEKEAALAETMKQLQQSQAEANRLVAEMRVKNTQITELAKPTTVIAASDAGAQGAVVVKFGVNSSVLDQTEANKLGSLITNLKASTESKVQLRGYADKTGNSEYNLTLSKARAMIVKETLRQSGVAADRIEVMPLGSFTAQDSAKAEDLRKVEILVVK